MGFLDNKKILIAGVASDRSIAAGTARAMAAQGAQLAFTYQTDKLKPRVESIAEATGSNIVIPCDVAFDEQIDDLAVLMTLFAAVDPHQGDLALLHSCLASATPTKAAPTQTVTNSIIIRRPLQASATSSE